MYIVYCNRDNRIMEIDSFNKTGCFVRRLKINEVIYQYIPMGKYDIYLVQ